MAYPQILLRSGNCCQGDKSRINYPPGGQVSAYFSSSKRSNFQPTLPLVHSHHERHAYFAALLDIAAHGLLGEVFYRWMV